MYEACETAHGGRPATKSEEKDLVVVLVVLEDEVVALVDVLGEATTGDVPGGFSPSGSDPFVIEGDLSCGAVEHEVEELVDVGVVIRSTGLSRAIGKHHDVLRHVASLHPDHGLEVPRR